MATLFDRKNPCSAATVTTVVTSVAVWLAPAYVAVMVVDAATLVVDTENERVLDPSGIVTLAGTTTAALLLASVTAAPPVGAAEVSVRVAVTGVPPETELDDSTMLASPAVVGAVVVVGGGAGGGGGGAPPPGGGGEGGGGRGRARP